MSGPTPPPLPPDLELLLRHMHLPYMRRMAPEVLATARAQRWDPAEVLKVLLGEEVAGCERSALATRRAQAAFPTGKTFSTWDANLSSIPAPTQTALGTLEWIGRHENLVVCGPWHRQDVLFGRARSARRRGRSQSGRAVPLAGPSVLGAGERRR